ncbi:MAG TPA: hypothetical protein VH593_05695 [Ktedonobacteraceae bacterium]|jgi:hypothetical protein
MKKHSSKQRHVHLLLLVFLSCLALGGTGLAFVASYRAYQLLHWYVLLVQARDVSTIRPWMTLHYIAHVYQVPEGYLVAWLDSKHMPATQHATLQMLADDLHQPVNQLIHSIQSAILAYRQQHGEHFLPSSQGSSGMLSLCSHALISACFLTMRKGGTHV